MKYSSPTLFLIGMAIGLFLVLCHLYHLHTKTTTNKTNVETNNLIYSMSYKEYVAVLDKKYHDGYKDGYDCGKNFTMEKGLILGGILKSNKPIYLYPLIITNNNVTISNCIFLNIGTNKAFGILFEKGSKSNKVMYNFFM